MDYAKLEKFYQDYVNSMLKTGESPRNIATFQDFVANYAENQQTQNSSAPAPTPAVAGAGNEPLTDIEAATRIQRAWRRHIDIQVYKYYRDLINFKQKGDPQMMMRCINPLEAKLMDPAAGIHVKFRLAGEKFPPNIYYKIFTHRPVQDMCANSPKDYTSSTCKLKDTRLIHNNTLTLNLPGDGKENGGTQESDGKISCAFTVDADTQTFKAPWAIHSLKHHLALEGVSIRQFLNRQSSWYQREENNGWRLVSDRMIAHIMVDPVTWDTNRKKVEFHHNKKQRKTDAERRRKQRKIAWMKKMHSHGLLQAKGSDPDTTQLVEHAAKGMVETLDNEGTDAVEDWEVDELLEWTMALNFDDYLATWKEIATSAGSEDHIEAKSQLYMMNNEDPFTLTVSYPTHSLPKSGVSYNTPISTMVVDPSARTQ